MVGLSDLLLRLVAILAPLFVCVGIGFGWARSGRRIDNEFVANLLINVSLPCLVFSKLTQSGITPDDLGLNFGAALAGTAALVLVGLLLLKPAGIAPRAALPAIAFPNMGNMGIPICLLAFGNEGASLATIYFFTSSLITHGLNAQWLAGAFTLGRILRMPLVYGVMGAVAFVVSGVPVPDAVANTTHILGSMVIPVMLIALGVSLAALRVNRLARCLVVVAIRFVAGWIVGLSIVAVFALEGVAASVALIQMTMPSAVVNYLYAKRFDSDPELVAGVVFLSTLLSVLTIPLTLSWLLWPV